MDSCFQQMLPPSSKALTYMYVFSDEYTNFLHDIIMTQKTLENKYEGAASHFPSLQSLKIAVAYCSVV